MNKNKILTALFLVFALGGCKDYLEEENKTFISADKYYTTKDGYESLVNSTYATLREVYDLPWVFEAGTDMYVPGRTDNQPEALSEYRNLTPTDGNVATFYAS